MRGRPPAFSTTPQASAKSSTSPQPADRNALDARRTLWATSEARTPGSDGMRISRRVPTPRSPTPAALRWQQHSIRTHHRRRKSDRLPPDRDRSHRQKTCFQPHRPRQVPAFPAAPEDREPAARTSPARRRRRTQKQVASIVQRPWTEFITDAHSGLLERQKSTAPTRRTANNTTQTRRTTGKHRAESLGGE